MEEVKKKIHYYQSKIQALTDAIEEAEEEQHEYYISFARSLLQKNDLRGIEIYTCEDRAYYCKYEHNEDIYSTNWLKNKELAVAELLYQLPYPILKREFLDK